MSLSIEQEKQSAGIPPLESGDRLTLCEFRRRYEALDTRAMLVGDLSKVFAVLEEGLRSEEHRRFIASLKQKAKSV